MYVYNNSIQEYAIQDDSVPFAPSYALDLADQVPDPSEGDVVFVICDEIQSCQKFYTSKQILVINSEYFVTTKPVRSCVNFSTTE